MHVTGMRSLQTMWLIETSSPPALRRPFCPWVKWHEAGGARRCGWSWFLDALVPVAVDATAAKASADAEVCPQQWLAETRHWKPLLPLRKVLVP